MKKIAKLSMMVLVMSGVVMADEITDILTETTQTYKSGDYAKVKEDLTYVLDLLRQKKGSTLKTMLPDALEGWKIETTKSNSGNAGMIGGVTSASRIYKKGSSKITINIITDSPLLQSIGMMISNPMFSSGGKLKRINRQKAIIEYKENRKRGKLTMVVDKRFVINVEGKNISEEDLISYAKAIDVKKLKALK